MTWSSAHGVDVTVGLMVGRSEPVSLRPSDNGHAILTIGHTFEALLTEPHLSALRDQIDPTLTHLRTLDAAETAIAEVQNRATKITAEPELSRLDAAVTAAWEALEAAEQATVEGVSR